MNPKFKVGEAVMVRSKYSPHLNCDFAIILTRSYRSSVHIYTGEESTGWKYKTNTKMDFGWWRESALRPIPKENPNGIDAEEFIKNLTGVTCE